MAIELTPDQERRIQAVVETGAYPTAEDALDAALAAVEIAASPQFEGSTEQMERLLREGMDSRTLSDDEFWTTVHRETDAMLAEYKRDRRE